MKVGDKVVNKNKESLGDVNTISWLRGDGEAMRLKGHDFNHVYVVAGFRLATPKEIEQGFRDE